MKLLDFKNMKKVASDKNTTTFLHDKGHKITIVHSALPKLQQAQIKRIPLSDGGKVKHFDDGGYSGLSQDGDQPIPQIPATSQDAQSPSPAAATSQPTPAPSSNQTPASTPDTAPASPQTQSDNANNPLTKQAQVTLGAADEYKKGVDLQRDAEIKQQKQLADISQQRIDAEQAYQTQIKNNLDSVTQATKAFKDYMTDHPINPNHYTENMSVPGKVSTALALILGGLGGGISGRGGNVALDYLNNQINRDIDAQKARADQQKTIYGAYQNLFQNSNAAAALTKASMNDLYAQKAQQIAQQLGTPLAMSKAQMLKSQFDANSSQQRLDAAKYLLGTGGSGSGGGGNIKQSGPVSYDPKDYKDPLDTPIKPMLAHDAQQKFRQANPELNPLSRADYGKLSDQYDNLEQTDRVLSNMQKAWKIMAANRTAMERGAQIAQSSGVPILGAGVGGLYTVLSADDPQAQNYRRALAQIRGDLRAAYPDISADEVDKMLAAAVPVRGQTPTQMFDGRTTLENTIKSRVKRGTADKYSLTNP